VTHLISSLKEILDVFDVAVLDQWGVLHNGSLPYPNACQVMRLLKENKKEIVILSNSGKRSAANLKRIEKMGFPVEIISKIITSGETLWEDITELRLHIDGEIPRNIYPIYSRKSDPIDWASDSNAIEITYELNSTTDVILLMGLPDGSAVDKHDDDFKKALQFQVPLICSNPDKASPRAGGLVVSPGALAQRYEEMGGEVIWYGKPYSPVYQAITRCFPSLNPHRFLMVGDSMEHDIAGAQNAGFLSTFVRAGVHAGDFENARSEEEILKISEDIAAAKGIRAPDFSLEFLT